MSTLDENSVKKLIIWQDFKSAKNNGPEKELLYEISKAIGK